MDDNRNFAFCTNFDELDKMLKCSFIPFCLYTSDCLRTNIEQAKCFMDVFNASNIFDPNDHFEYARKRQRLSKNIISIIQRNIEKDIIFYVDLKGTILFAENRNRIYVYFKNNFLDLFKNNNGMNLFYESLDLTINQRLIGYFSIHKQLIFHPLSNIKSNSILKITKRCHKKDFDKTNVYVSFEEKPYLKLKHYVKNFDSFIDKIIYVDEQGFPLNITNDFISFHI